MAKKAAGAAKKRSGSLSVHLVLLLVLAVLGWRLYVQQGENEKARAEHDAYAQQVETLKQDNEALRAGIAEGATDEKMESWPGTSWAGRTATNTSSTINPTEHFRQSRCRY